MVVVVPTYLPSSQPSIHLSFLPTSCSLRQMWWHTISDWIIINKEVFSLLYYSYCYRSTILLYTTLIFACCTAFHWSLHSSAQELLPPAFVLGVVSFYSLCIFTHLTRLKEIYNHGYWWGGGWYLLLLQNSWKLLLLYAWGKFRLSFLFLIASSPFLFLKHHMFFIFDREKVKQLFICSDSYQLLLEEIKFDFRGLW